MRIRPKPLTVAQTVLLAAVLALGLSLLSGYAGQMWAQYRREPVESARLVGRAVGAMFGTMAFTVHLSLFLVLNAEVTKLNRIFLEGRSVVEKEVPVQRYECRVLSADGRMMDQFTHLASPQALHRMAEMLVDGRKFSFPDLVYSTDAPLLRGELKDLQEEWIKIGYAQKTSGAVNSPVELTSRGWEWVRSIVSASPTLQPNRV
jgi:hypothetical protein